jgi:hypothetical protein
MDQPQPLSSTRHVDHLTQPTVTQDDLAVALRGPDSSAAAAGSFAGLTPSQVRPLLAELIHAQLIVERYGNGRYSMHVLLQAYASELVRDLDSDGVRQYVTEAMLAH